MQKMHFGYHVDDLKGHSISCLTMNQTKSVNAKKILCVVIHMAYKAFQLSRTSSESLNNEQLSIAAA